MRYTAPPNGSLEPGQIPLNARPIQRHPHPTVDSLYPGGKVRNPDHRIAGGPR
jgi:hypothetical protein